MVEYSRYVAAVVALAVAFLSPWNAVNRPALASEIGALGKQGLSNVEVTSIKQTIVAWTDALINGDLELWNSYWAPGSVLMPPGLGRITGAAMRNSLARTPPYDNIASATFSDWDVVGREDLAVVANNITIQPKSGGPPNVSKQLIIMRRHGTNKWLVQAVMFNALN